MLFSRYINTIWLCCCNAPFIISFLTNSVYSATTAADKNEISSLETPTCGVPASELEKSAMELNKEEKNNQVSGRLAFSELGRLWPRGQVYFVIDEERLTNAQIAMVYEAFSEFHSKTCIRFKPWIKSATRSGNYINITSSKSGPCSLSDVCMKGGQQFVTLRKPCWFKEMVIHQLGHALCLGHEHQRPIRDSYLSYRHTCTEKEIPHKLDDNQDHYGFYDYASLMHFPCGWCSGGWPRNENVSGCGYQVSEGLSLLDIDYINLLYGCGGCNRHRWMPIDKLVRDHEDHMHSFGYQDRMGYPLYPCRVSYGGEIILGKFTWALKVCSFTYNGEELYKVGAGTEVLLIPGGVRNSDSVYKLEYSTAHKGDKLLKMAVPAGRLSEQENYGTTYVAYGHEMISVDLEYEDTIGFAAEREGRIPQAYLPIGGKEVRSNYFKVLTCQNPQTRKN